MSDIIYYYPTNHEQHFEAGHPERPARIKAIYQWLEEANLWEPYPKADPLKISKKVLESIHTPHHLARLEAACKHGQRLDTDTYLTAASWQIALNSMGGAAAVAQAVWRKEAKRGFALTRPPGHHATPDQAMGFCLLNSIAVAAENLLQNEGAERIAIIDLDVHHGNGTQDIFYFRDDVFFISIHQSPLYPGTGHMLETGDSIGKGATLNIPLPPTAGDIARETAFDEIIFPLLNNFKPEILLISAGLDSHWNDPLAHHTVTAQGYGNTIRSLTEWADINCEGRIAMFLEGGYNLNAGAACALTSVQAMLGLPITDKLGPSNTDEDDQWKNTLEEVKNIWNLL